MAVVDIHSGTAEERVRALMALIDVDTVDENIFEGRRKQGGVGRIFGGEVIAQALAAACKTVASDRAVHSLHAYFLRGGDETRSSRYKVDADFDGRSFSNRRVVATQNDKVILNLTASFHCPEDGRNHQAEMPDVPGPNGLAGLPELLRQYRDGSGKQPRAASFIARPWPFDMRPVGPMAMMPSEPREPETAFWFRAAAPVEAPQWMHRAMLAFLSDIGLLSSATLPHGRFDIEAASLDHSIWFHDDVNVDEWMLYQIQSPWSGGARGLGLGRVFGKDGRLIASMAQEGLMRDRALSVR